MKALLSWIDDRSGLVSAVRKCLYAPVPGGACWLKVWPCTIAFSFCVQAITGFFIWMFYSPSTQTAWESVYFLQYKVAGGWLLRAVHHYSAQVLLVLIGIYLIQMIVTGAYRAPREFVFWTAVLMGLVTLGLMLTGDLLAWDQNSFASTKVRVNFLYLLPGIGGGLFKLAAGGPAFGQLTLARFVSLHIGLLAGGFLGLLILHLVSMRRADATEAATAERVVPYWPDQGLRSTVAMLVVLAAVLALALQHGTSGDRAGVTLGSPADMNPANPYAAARPEWAFRGLYQFSHLLPESPIVPIFIIPGLLVCLVLAMPFIAKCKGGHWFNLGFTAVVLIAIVGLSVQSVATDLYDNDHQAAVAAEVQRAVRVRELAEVFKGIPPTGALTLLRNDPKTQGPVLFKTHCASCHNHLDAEGNGIAAEKSSAPDLFGFATTQWLQGLLDPKRIGTSEYFGDTKLKTMKAQVEDTMDELDEIEQEEIRSIAMALSAEAQFQPQPAADAEKAAQIEQGRAMLSDWPDCTGCHKFHDEGRLGSAPDLTGYGSRQWIVGIISNPAHKRFYGDKNDRMPAYAEFPDDRTENTLSLRDIGLLADWLRGEWPEG